MAKKKLWPSYLLKRNKKRVAVNPALVSAIHGTDGEVTEIYTLDCAADDDAWDVQAPFNQVLADLSGYGDGDGDA